jgi:hypothetical protein
MVNVKTFSHQDVIQQIVMILQGRVISPLTTLLTLTTGEQYSVK